MVIIEMTGAFLFVLLVLTLKRINGAQDQRITNAMAIGFALYGIAVTFRFSGIMNPAVGLAQPVYQHLVFKDVLRLGLIVMPIYCLAPLAGGALAGVFSKFNVRMHNKFDHVGY